nr:hypothetical protein [Tanacetum cinerariifolium]
MKDHKCNETFNNFLKCVEDVEKNDDEPNGQCFKVAMALQECLISTNKNHYRAILPDTKDGEDQETRKQEIEECGYCVFMKDGKCKETFTEWEKCVEEAKKNDEDIANKCSRVSSALQDCMQANEDYYLLRLMFIPSPTVRKDAHEKEVIAKELGVW